MFESSVHLIEDMLVKHGAINLSGKNEAATRLHIIDRILFEGLGWERHLCMPEKPLGGKSSGFIDYALVHGSEEYIVVEAKRFGKTFELPPEKDHRNYLIGTLLQHCGIALNEVIEQAHQYAVGRGIPFAVATNGHQWLIFRPYTRGKHWHKSKAIVFRGFDDLSSNWSQFYGLLARDNVVSGHLDAALLTPDAKSPTFARTYNQERGIDTGKGSNELAKSFNTVFRQVFDSIVEDETMLRNCYVGNDASRSYQQQFASLITKSVPHFLGETETAVAADGKPTGDLKNRMYTPSVVVLVGNVGAGKTTFVHHFLKVYLPSQNGAPIHCFVKDLKDEAAAVGNSFDATQAEREFYVSLLEDVEKNFSEVNPYEYAVQRQIFSHDLVRLKSGARKREFENDKSAYLKAEADLLASFQDDPKKLCVSLLKHISANKGRPLCVAFDNVDQGSDTYQQFIYTLAHRLARDAQCVVLVTLRHSVYETAREKGFLDIRNDVVFRVTPPNLKEVVSKRIKHARTLLVAQKTGKTNDPKSAARLAEYLEVINELLLGEADDVRRMLEALSAGNIRSAFSNLQRFAVSGHTNVSELITVYNEAKSNRRHPRYSIRDFFRPFVLGDNHRYHSRDSPVLNLFEVSLSRVDSHFQHCRILAYLLDRYATGEGGRKGEVQVTEVIVAMAGAGHAEASVIQACQHLARHNLIERLSSHIRPLSRDDVIRISAAGNYYISDILYLDDYIYFISQDTCIYDADAFKALEAAQRNIETRKSNRLAAVTEMLNYLRRQESIERSRTGAATHGRRSWDRAFAVEIGRKIIGGDSWEEHGEEFANISVARLPAKNDSTLPQSSGQLGLTGVGTNSPSVEEVKAAALSLPPLTAIKTINGSRQLSRVLWGLRLAQIAGLPPLNASQLARLISSYGMVPLEGTNIARFFRTDLAKFRDLFIVVVDQKYSLSSEGTNLFAREFQLIESNKSGERQ